MKKLQGHIKYAFEVSDHEFIYLLAMLHSLWGLSSLTRDGTRPRQWKHRALTTGLPRSSPDHEFKMKQVMKYTLLYLS